MTVFDETYTLNDGNKIPRFALGTWEIDDDKVADAARSALKIGYRHIDTAQAYGNERGVGEGIRTAGIPRDQIFVNSKVAAEIKNYDEAKKSIDETLAKMGLDYLDMMIIHNPQPWLEVNQSSDRHFEGNLETWRAMEDAVKAGKLKSIGVSSFQPEDLDNLIKHSATNPAVNQILSHIASTPLELIQYSQTNDIAVEAFSPIAHGLALQDQEIEKMAAKYDVSVPQLAIRYDWQLSTVVLPKTENPAHMAANAEIDFEISAADMEKLKNVKPLDYGDASVYPVFGGKLSSYDGTPESILLVVLCLRNAVSNIIKQI
ncbi:aldo/keto reductase [Paucilactobacillus wasatchensis]|uniref:Oxidoreductase of aldo/keto reductase family, subgroup 1 n=1 Tax=Paucilactobacillus wasatchensis TaxID=1335616 RepID=A0A0D1A515_9LACO|nr:aldo/keto reductase [Paucilactobacillus wasatchensis]KIS02807.1 oxidoreductase of aldo/keto reductase family, subgroup 1 [Paucilactobacillus wasatchensis]